MALWLAIGLIAVPIAFASAQDARMGGVRVTDGDSLRLSGRKVRLWGIDAPELDQRCSTGDGNALPCGRMARNALRRIVGRETPVCTVVDIDRYDRSVERCSVKGRDLGLAMLREGWATHFIYQGRVHPWEAVRHARYRQAESEAQRKKAGIWAWRFERPSDHRRRTRPGASVN